MRQGWKRAAQLLGKEEWEKLPSHGNASSEAPGMPGTFPGLIPMGMGLLSLTFLMHVWILPAVTEIIANNTFPQQMHILLTEFLVSTFH